MFAGGGGGGAGAKALLTPETPKGIMLSDYFAEPSNKANLSVQGCDIGSNSSISPPALPQTSAA